MHIAAGSGVLFWLRRLLFSIPRRSCLEFKPEAKMESAYGAPASSAHSDYGSGYGADSYGSSSGYGGGSGGEVNTDVPPGRFTQAEGADPAVATKRKLIYKTTMSIVIEDLDAALASLSKIVNDSDGFVASNQLSSAVQNRREGVWVIRVPVDATAMRSNN